MVLSIRLAFAFLGATSVATAGRSRVLILLASLWIAAPRASAQESPLDSALLQQCMRGETQEVANLLKQGASPNAAGRERHTALHRAASRGHLKIMRLLIDHGADVNATDLSGCTVLREAAGSREPQAVKMLLDAGARPDESALGQASWLGRVEAAKHLLDAGVSPNAGMVQAAQGGRLDILRLLLGKGANVNAKSKEGNTPLHTGALQGGFETVQLLLKAGADANATNNKAETPLHMAVSGDCDLKTIKLLVQSGARLDLPNKEGVTPVRLAAIRGAKDIYDWLVAVNGGKEPRVPRANAQPQGQGAKSTKELLAALSSEKEEIRLAAQRELVARGKQVMPDVLKSIESGTGIERFYELFAEMGPEAESALPLLKAQLGKEEHVFIAAITIDRIKPGAVADLPEKTKQEVAAAIYAAIVGEDVDVMSGFYAGQLVNMGKSAAPTILRLLRHEKPDYRRVAARVLADARFSDEELEAELVKLTRDADPHVRRAAALALGAFGGPSQKVKEALLAMIKNPGEAADYAARSLGRFGASAIDDLIPLLSAFDNAERKSAITAFASIGAPAVPRLIELLAHEVESTAVSASAALNRIGQPAVPELAKAVRTGTEQVTDHAANALWWIGPGAKAALPDLLAVAGSEQRSDVSRLAVARAALKIDAANSRESKAVLSTIPALIRILEKGSFQHQGWAAETLRGIGAPARDALPILRKRLELPDENTDTDGLVRDYVQRRAKEAISAIEADLAKDSSRTP